VLEAGAMTFDIRALASNSNLPRLLSRRMPLVRIVFLIAVLESFGGSPLQGEKVELLADQENNNDQNYYANAHPYLEEPLEQLINQIPELNTIRPASDQKELPSILEKTGKQVDDFFWNIVDVTAHEVIKEEKLGRQGRAASFEIEDSYLILRRGTAMLGTFDEYRMDSNGNRLEETGLNNGYFVTSGFALNQVYFSSELQAECKFHYLGEQKTGTRDTYVVAFAQIPAEATITVEMEVHQGQRVNGRVSMLVQGIAWMDKSNFQIIRMRTDLLAPRADVGLDRETTIVEFGEVRLPDVASPLWLPKDVHVNAHFAFPSDQMGYNQLNFRNEHGYSDYKSYRVSVKMVPDANESALANAPGGLRMDDESAEQRYYANAHPYLYEALDRLGERIPELRNIQPTDDSQQLPVILEKTGSTVDNFLRQIVDLTAQEQITQERVNNKRATAKEQVQDNYLILRQRDGDKVDIVEYRTDAEGKRMEHTGLNKGFLVTSGFALSCEYFSTRQQQESVFRYMGEQKIGGHDTYVVAFAQKPGQATIYVTMTMAERNVTRVRFLMQGLAWVDKSNFQIVRMRTDLLVPVPEIALDNQTTEVTFSKVQLLEVASPLWLPREVKVHLRFKEVDAKRGKTYELDYRNDHHYTDYQRFRVSVKMTTPQ
jgi:predicted nucleic acid-binding protein